VPTPFDHRPECYEQEVVIKMTFEGDNAHIAFMQVAKAMQQALTKEADQMMLDAKQQEQQALLLAQQMQLTNQLAKRSNVNGTQ
jgi:hypothetical protein